MSTFACSWLRHGSCLLILSTILTFPPDSLSQNSIAGCIEDSRGGTISDARVIAQHVITGRTLRSRADAEGCFRLLELEAGPTRLDVLIEAFSPYETEIAVGGEVELEPIVLKIRPIRNLVTVTANRTAMPSQSLGSSLDVIERGEIEALQTRNAADLLRNLAGVTLQQTGASGLTNFFVRGGESDYNKVLIDGVPVNLPGDTYDFAHVSTDNVERVEFVRGPQSALFGSDAMTSVVQIFTRTGMTSPEVNYTAEGGSFNTLRQSGSVRGNFRGIDFSNTFSRLDTDNVAENNDYRNASYFGNFGYKPTPDQSLRLTVSHGSVRTGTPGPTAPGFISFDPTGSMRRQEKTLGLGYDTLVGNRLNQHVAYRFHDLDQTFFGSFGPFGVAGTRHRMEYRGDLFLGRGGTLSYGVDFDREKGVVSDSDRKRDNYGYYLQQQIEPAPGFHVTAGVRVEDNDSFGTVASPRLGVSYLLLNPSAGPVGSGRIRFTAGRGIKEPRFLESFSESPFFLGNPDLESERSRSWEIGWEQGFGDDLVVADVTWFDNRFQNLIQLVASGGGNSQYQNIGLTTARGLELRGRVRLGHLHANTNYTYLDGQVVDSLSGSFPFRAGDPLLRRPEHSGDFRLSWIDDRFLVAWNSRFVGHRADSDFFSHSPPLERNERYTVSDVAVTVEVAPQVSVFFSIKNVFDRSYQEVLGFPALGRAVNVGTRFRWGGDR
jgi:vitamin B12 transporter